MIRYWLCAAAAFITGAAPRLLHAVQQDTSDARMIIVVDSLDRAAFANVAELLQARVPGLHVSRTGDDGLQWYMRGPSSASESTPLVLVDDARFNVAGSALRQFGTRPPLLDEVDIEDVERIEIWSGPATAARYGSGSANGVIRIVTSAPRAQKTSFRAATAVGAVNGAVSYPPNFARHGVDTAGRPVPWCTLSVEARGGCVPGPVTSINVLEIESPFETGITARAAATVASGSQRFAWLGGGTFDRQGSTTGTLASQRFHLRGAAALRASESADVTVRIHGTRAEADLASSNAFNEPSLLRQSILARADTIWSGFTGPHTPRYGSWRFGANVSGIWRPRSGVDARLTSGIARMRDEDDLEYTIPPRDPFEALSREARGERRRRDFTVRLEAEARYGAGALQHATALTFERAESRQEEEFREVLTGSGGVVGALSFSINRQTEIVGAALTQRLSLGERARVAGGLRLDRVAQYKVRWDVPVSPQVSVTWDVRPFAPAALGGIRLRAALGDVANVPQTTPPVLGFVPASPDRAEQPKAEVTRERELGLDMRGAHDRVGLSLTWYIKRTSNVASFHPDPGLIGAVRVNQLEVRNHGIEGRLSAEILRWAHGTWGVRAWYAYNQNEVTRSEFGQLLIAVGELGLPHFQVAAVGQPLAAHRTVAVAIRDLDNDGLLDHACWGNGTSNCEVTLGQTRFTPAFPPTAASLETSVRVGVVTFSALLDHRSGHTLHNQSEAVRCLYSGCRALFDASTTLREQAEAMVADDPAAFVEDASYTKVREVSVRVAAPARWAAALGASGLDISLAGRNLATWSDYRGPDPESSSMPWVPLASVDYGAMPVPRRFHLRVDLHR